MVDNIGSNLLKEIWEKHKSDNEYAIIYKRKNKINKISYSQLFDYVFRFSSFLKRKKVKKGDKVVISLMNSPEFYIIDLACLNLGLVVVPVIGINQKDFDYILNEIKPKLIFSEKRIRNTDNFIINLNKNLNENLDFNGNKLKEFVRNDIANIVYTSGSSGNPKGVLISNFSILSNIVSQPLEFKQGEVIVSYLPLSHMFERVCGFYAPLYRGSSIAVSNPSNLIGDLKDYKPHALLSVPRVLEKIYQGINSKRFSRWLLKLPLGKRIVASGLNSRFGGRLKFLVSGGSKLDSDKHRFFWDLGLRVFEGYGMTEAGPVISTNYEKEYKHGSVGKPLKDVRVKIDKDEILIKSPGLMEGYFNSKRLKKGEWFRTGDKGFIDDEGFLYVLGRLDDKIVLTNSKKTYPEPIEKRLNKSKYIKQSFVYGDGRPYLVGLIVSDYPEKIEKVVKKVNSHLNWYERVRRFRVIKQEFSVENTLLTMSYKLRRKKIYEVYQDLIGEMYND